MAIPLGLGGAALLGATIGLGVEHANLKSKIRHRDRDIANLKTENQALRDQLEQSQNQQNQQTPPTLWSNFMQLPQMPLGLGQPQQPTTQMLNMVSMLMQMMQMGMGSAPAFNNVVGPQIGNYGNCNSGAQNFFGQLQNLMTLTNGLGNAVNTFSQLGQPSPMMPGAMPPAMGPGPSIGFTPPGPTMPTYGQPPVPTFGAPNTDRADITTLGKYATKLFPGGKNITMGDIQRMARGGRCPDGTEPPADLKMACLDIVKKPELFNERLQSAFLASKGKADNDGKASVRDVATLMQQLKAGTPNAPTTFNTNTPYMPNAAYGSSFVQALMGHLGSSGVNPFMLSLLQQPQMQQPMLAH